MLDTRLPRLIDDMLDQRPVDDRQHLPWAWPWWRAGSGCRGIPATGKMALRIGFMISMRVNRGAQGAGPKGRIRPLKSIKGVASIYNPYRRARRNRWHLRLLRGDRSSLAAAIPELVASSAANRHSGGSKYLRRQGTGGDWCGP